MPEMLQKLTLIWTALILPSLTMAQTQVRLRGTGFTASQGRVEVLHEGQWGTICDDEFGSQEVGVICRMLGYNNGGNATSSSVFGQGTGPIWMDNLQCDGTEANIDVCLFGGWNNTDCTHSEDVGVVCETSGVTPVPTGAATTRPPATVQPNNCGSNTTPGTPSTGDVRIVGPSNLVGVGFVEVYYNNQWGAICDDFWGTANARVVCNQLCFNGSVARAGAQVEVNYVRDNVSTNIFLDDVRCRGDETRISQCNSSAWNVTDCTINEIISVSCVQLDESPPPPPVPVLECDNGLISASFSTQADSNLEEKHLNVFSGACADATKATDANFVTIRIPFDRCGTEVTQNETHLVYSNVIRYDYTRYEGAITRVNTYRVEVSCEFPRDLNVDNGMRPLTETVTQKAPGQFRISMSFFQNNSFNIPVQNYPLNLTLGEWLNVALTLEAIDQNLKLVVPNCTATPSTSAEDSVNYPLFETKCANDPTLGFFPLNSTSFGYRYQTFKFVQFDMVYLHCDAFVCLLTEKDAQCDRSCNSSSDATGNSGRKRRDTSDIVRPRDIYHVMSGPINFRKNGDNSNAIIREWNITASPTSSTSTPVTTRRLQTTQQPIPTSSATTRRPTTQSTRKPTTTTTSPTTTAATTTTAKPTTSVPTTQTPRPTTTTTTPRPTSSPSTTSKLPRSTTKSATQQPTSETTKVTSKSPTTPSPTTAAPNTKSASAGGSKLYTTSVRVTSVTSSPDNIIEKDKNNFDFNKPYVAGLGNFVRGAACQTLLTLSTITFLLFIHVINHMLQKVM